MATKARTRPTKAAAPRAALLEKDPTDLHEGFVEFIKEEVGYDADLKSVQLATLLRMEYQKSEGNQARLAANKEARAAAEEEREAKREERAAKRAEREQAKAEKKTAAKKTAAAPAAKKTAAAKKAAAPAKKAPARRRKAAAAAEESFE